MNYDQTLERAERLAAIAALVAFAFAAMAYAMPAKQAAPIANSAAWHSVKARQSIDGRCIVLAHAGSPNGFAVCGE